FNSHATVYLNIHQPTNVTVNFALPTFVPLTDGQLASTQTERVREELKSALETTGCFNFLNPQSFIQEITPQTVEQGAIRFNDWKAINAQYLLTTGYSAKGVSVHVEARLFHIPSAQRVMGKEYTSPIGETRQLALTMGNDIIEALTGEKGIFFSKIAFIANVTGHKELYVMDFDGKNVQQVTRNRSISLSPSWSPNAKELLYTLYRIHSNNQVNPDLVRFDIKSRRTIPVWEKRGLNTGGAWSPKREEIIITHSPPGGDTDLYLVTPQGKLINRLTNESSIDVEPSWSPDGNQIAWVSSRRGNPMVFIMNRDGTDIKRLTYAGQYNSSPVWSPDGKQIAFASQSGDTFDIFLMDSNGQNLRRLTKSSGRSNEHPSFSPDGRHIVFHSSGSKRSDIYVVNLDGTVERCLTCQYTLGKAISPTWSSN
ncbi:MAG TPA: hypothetical protein VJL87_05225, partial [Bdellovibrionota bacterium]|nr:hypothetical protein [Bdellovibrionota bacterium]